jgi:hypothetical protein
MNWHTKVSQNLTAIPDFINYYELELVNARKQVGIYGRVEKNITDLPGVTEERFGQLQEIEAVLNYLNIELRKLRRKFFQKYLEGYNRVLSSRDAEKYVDGEQEFVNYEIMINEVALLRNKFLGIMKGLENKSYGLNNIVKLRCAGMEDVIIG